MALQNNINAFYQVCLAFVWIFPDSSLCFLVDIFRKSDHYSRGESGRRRHPSGNRTLSTISDNADPALVLGFDRNDEFLVSWNCAYRQNLYIFDFAKPSHLQSLQVSKKQYN